MENTGTQISNIENYIETQEKHHEKRSFMEEYLEFLKSFEMECDENRLSGRLNDVKPLRGFCLLRGIVFY
jgi:hypothetical protein